MLFHISMSADDPARVSAAIAELWGGASLPFPPFPGSFIAMAGDARASAIEVYPRGTALYPAKGQNEVEARPNEASRHGPCHVAIATPLTETQVHAIARREGWESKTLPRGGGLFHVIEFWVEGSFMIEVLTPEMQAEYTGGITIEGWRAMLDARGAGHSERVLQHA